MERKVVVELSEQECKELDRILYDLLLQSSTGPVDPIIKTVRDQLTFKYPE